LPRRLLTGSLLGAIDQAVLSAFSLGVGLAFIRLGSKYEYAAYTLLFSALQLAQAVQNALISSPLTTLGAGRSASGGVNSLTEAAKRLQSWLVAAIVGACVLGALWDWFVGAARVPVIAALALASAGLLSREFIRAGHFLRHQALRALASDLFYVGVAAALIGALILAHALTAALVLGAMGVAGLTSAFRSGLGSRRLFGAVPAAERAHMIELWACAKWALPSVVNSWLQANAFLFLVQWLISHEAVADLSASRLLLVPLSFLAVGWASAFRPRATSLFANGQVAQVHRMAMRSAIGFLAVGAIYGGCLYLAMPLLQSAVLGPKYTGLGWMVVSWLVLFIVMAVRGVGMTCMLTHPSGFRSLYVYGCVALIVAVPAVVMAGLAGSLPCVVAGLSLSELVLAGLIWGHGWPALRRIGARPMA